MAALHTTCKEFDSLTSSELYSILRLRSEVFVVEQSCAFQDMDNKDQHSYHLMIYDPDLIAYSRLVPAGVSYNEMSIGRVVTKLTVRGTGVGKILMEESIRFCYEKFGVGPIRIGAQCYAEKFYRQFGFVPQGDVYDEDGIPHVQMIKF